MLSMSFNEGARPAIPVWPKRMTPCEALQLRAERIWNGWPDLNVRLIEPETLQDLATFICLLLDQCSDPCLHACASHEELGFHGRNFDRYTDLISWVYAQNERGASCYWSVGANPAVHKGKLLDHEVRYTLALVVDIDDRNAGQHFRDLLRQHGIPRPSIVVRTGTIPHDRYQLVWRLKEPETDLAAWTSISRNLTELLGGDRSCGGPPSHLFRLPGLMSRPKAEKRTRGYVDERVTIVDIVDAAYLLDDFDHLPRFAPVHVPAATRTVSATTWNGVDVGAVIGRLEAALVAKLQQRTNGRDPRRHRHLYHCCMELFRAGLGTVEVAAVIAAHPDGVGHKWVTDWRASPRRLVSLIDRYRGMFERDRAAMAEFDAHAQEWLIIDDKAIQGGRH